VSRSRLAGVDAPDFTKPHYVVTWSIDVWADTPREAAEEARAILTDDTLVETIFEVEPYVERFVIDLDEDATVRVDTHGGDR